MPVVTSNAFRNHSVPLLNHHPTAPGPPLKSELARVQPNSRLAAGKLGGATLKVLLAALTLLACSDCSNPSSTNLLRGSNAKVLNLEITPLSLAIRVQAPSNPMHIDGFSLKHAYLMDTFHFVFHSGPSPINHGLSSNELNFWPHCWTRDNFVFMSRQKHWPWDVAASL